MSFSSFSFSSMTSINRVCVLLLLGMLALSGLTGCVSREEADAKLALGCEAASLLFAQQGVQVETTGQIIFGQSDLGKNFRHVLMSVTETDGWHQEQKEYRCIFMEEFGFARLRYVATIYQVRVGDQIFGKEGNEIIGSLEDHIRLTDAVARAMR